MRFIDTSVRSVRSRRLFNCRRKDSTSSSSDSSSDSDDKCRKPNKYRYVIDCFCCQLFLSFIFVNCFFNELFLLSIVFFNKLFFFQHFISKNTKNEQPLKSGAGDCKLIPIRPEILDSKVRFTSVGGLENHVQCLKEMILLPMMYPEVFKRFQIQPPRGVLFHGPPGK